MTQYRSKTASVAILGILIALALALSLIDLSISAALSFLPGVRMGLAGGMGLFCVHRLGIRYAVIVLAAKCILTAAFSGSPTMLLFSAAGSFFGLLVTVAVYKHLSVIKTGVLGGITHNAAQMAVALMITGSAAFSWYLPVLLITGTVSGFAIGLVVNIVLQRTKNEAGSAGV